MGIEKAIIGGRWFVPEEIWQSDQLRIEALEKALIGLVGGCNEFRADAGRSTKYIQKIEKPLFAAQSLLAR